MHTGRQYILIGIWKACTRSHILQWVALSMTPETLHLYQVAYVRICSNRIPLLVQWDNKWT